jgi:zinc/manganese transport system permease protein
MLTASTIGEGGPSLDPISDLEQLTAFPFMVHALEAGTLVAVTAGLVGWFMVLRGQSFAGHTLSLMAFPGASAALLVGASPAAGYFLFCGLAALPIAGAAGPAARRNLGQESAVTGAVQAFGLACGFLFLSLDKAVLGDYENLLFGSFLGITSTGVLALGMLAALSAAALAILGRPLLFASVDEGVALARGVPVRALALAFLLLLGFAVAATAQITGVLLVFALLIAPAATAQLITARIGLSLLITVALGIAIAWSGLALSYFYGYPAGFYITTIAFALYLAVRTGRAVAGRPAFQPWRARERTRAR